MRRRSSNDQHSRLWKGSFDVRMGQFGFCAEVKAKYRVHRSLDVATLDTHCTSKLSPCLRPDLCSSAEHLVTSLHVEHMNGISRQVRC